MRGPALAYAIEAETLGFEAIQIFGARGYARLDVALGRRLILGTTVEVATQRHADSAGVRLVAGGTVDLGAGFSLGLRGGYQARSFASGGPSLGRNAGYAF